MRNHDNDAKDNTELKTFKTLAVKVPFLQTTQDLVISITSVFAEDSKENVPKIITHVHSHCFAH